MNITIRPTRLEELGQVMPFYERARRFMAANGNANQWINGYPSPDDIRQDIENGSSYVFVNENQELEGCFAFIRGEDPNYKVIKDGAWLNDAPYGVIHRIASGGRVKGLMDLCLEWCSSHCPNLRVDTHRDNKVLQNILLKNGFTYCGIIYVKTVRNDLPTNALPLPDRQKSEVGFPDTYIPLMIQGSSFLPVPDVRHAIFGQDLLRPCVHL